MSDELSLLLVLAALYLIECVRWIGAPGLALVGRRGAARLLQPGVWLGNRRGGLAWLGALEPPGAAFAAHPWPLSFGADAVCVETPYAWRRLGRPPASRAVVRYADLGPLSRRGSDVYRGDARWVACRSDAAAAEVVRLLAALRDGCPAERAARLEETLRARFARPAIEARLDAIADARRLPGYSAAALALLLFGAGPALTHRFGLVAIAAPFGAALLALHLLHLGLVFRAHRRLAPEARADRWIELAKLLVSPPMAIRAADALSWHRLAAFDPIAVAAVMLDGDAFAAFVGPVRRDLAHPIEAAGLEGQAAAIVQEERARMLAAVDRLLEERGLAVADRPPQVPEGGGFCPRCLGTYRRPAGVCGDCSGVGLLRA